jgi:two-component system KDP operon response regulator KdpE
MSMTLARVLVIEDEPQTHRFLRAVLGASGYSVERADTALEGLRLARSRAPDVVLLDLSLPDLGGHEVLTRLRNFSQVPVIILSARDTEEDKVVALDAGADDFIVKPFSVLELLARIRLAMRHRRIQDGVSEILSFDGLEVDIPGRRVAVQGETISVTAKEWQLLCTLARNAGRVVTHKQLLAAAWGPANGDNTQYLRVYIGTLRQKLGAAGRLIKTETSVGYRMSDYQE